ncbi:MAG: hypothetical protein WC637_20790 [Victivallales bacterium]
MPFEYKCNSCQAIGDLDSFVDQVECPSCGGMMYPVNAPPQEAQAADLGPDQGDTPTTIVPRAEILREIAATADQPRRVVKVAKFVNIGFGGMLTTSATRGFKPITPGKKDSGFPFSKQPPFPQQAQKQTAPSEKEALAEHAEPAKNKADSPSSNGSGGQRIKAFTVSKIKTPAPSPQQTATQYMDSTQVDPNISTNIHQHHTAPPPESVQPHGEDAPAPHEILPKPRISAPTSTSLKFLPKGALKVAQTHTSIQRSQLPSPPSKLTAQTHNPSQPQQQSPHFSELDEDFAAQVRIEAERREAILREAYRIAEEKIRKEREAAEKSSAEEKALKEEKEAVLQAEIHAENAEIAAKEAAKVLVTQITKELAETEELIRKERETLELRKKELQQIRRSAEEETAEAKPVQENRAAEKKEEKAENATVSPKLPPEPPPAETVKEDAKPQEPEKKLIITPQKPVKLKSSEGSETLMRSSKNLQIDKKTYETGKLLLKKEELEKLNAIPEVITEKKKDDAEAKKKSPFKGLPPPPPLYKKGLRTPMLAAKKAPDKTLSGKIGDEVAEKEKSSGSDVQNSPAKDKTPTKAGINVEEPMTNSALLKIHKRKKNIILLIVGLTVLAACLLIFFVGGEIVKMVKSSFSPSPAVAPSLPVVPQTLQMEYNAAYRRIKKTPVNRQEIDANIKELQDFIDKHPNVPDTDKYIHDAKTHVKDMQSMKELY